MNASSPVVLITGALTGIGRATAIAFAKEGASVVVSGRRDEAGQALAAELRGLGTVKRFRRLDVAINNAGTEGQLGPLTEQSADNYTATFDANVLGTLLSLKHEMRVMLGQGRGAIVNLSSMAGQVGVAGAAIYAASKHAVEGLTKSAALEGAATGVRVNAVAPGPVGTDMLDRFTGGNEAAKAGFLAMIPAKRAASPEEIAQTIVFLASDKARFLTGQSVAVDGGYTAQ
jgi:NAD(P)-dependent dehydrogenase (short-subunit alcohol dehydrogenase family)